MSKIQSIFGGYADQMQVIIDNSKDRFRPTWYGQFFNFAPPQTQLTYTSVIGKSRIEAAASVVDRNSRTPLRSRAAADKLSGEIPAIKEMIPLSEDDYRDFLALQNLNVSDIVKRNQVLDFIFNDIKTVGDAAHKRLDILCLQAVSTGKINITTANNPDGLVTSAAIDLFMPATNKINAAGTWNTSNTATPIADIKTVVINAMEKGRTFSKILMDYSTFVLFSKAKEVTDALASFYLVRGNASATLDRVNEFLTASQLPVIEIVQQSIGIESDGVIGAVNPWETTNIAFVPAGNLGVIKNAVAIEDLKPVTGVSYAKFNNATISKWSENEPFAEYTKVELNAFPAFEAIDGVFLLSRTAAF